MQVPTTRSRASWGIGDLADVAAVARWLHDLGGGTLALSPLHAPTPVAPIAASPYYPSSRMWRSPLLLRIDDVPGAAEADLEGLAGRARALLHEPLVDRDRGLGAPATGPRADLGAPLPRRGRPAPHLASRAGGRPRGLGPVLCPGRGPRRHLAPLAGRGSATQTARRWPPPSLGWATGWPSTRWLQLLVDEQLEAARQVGPRLIQDLAIGADPGGADAWIWQDLLASGFDVGRPTGRRSCPRARAGGCPRGSPGGSARRGYRPLAGLLRANLRSGGLRIDHVMGLSRLFWVPEGGRPADGAYVRFAGRELLDLVALESARAQAVVVGEDLGTVEPGFREELQETGILSTRVVWFEEEPPETLARGRPWRWSPPTTCRRWPAWPAVTTAHLRCEPTSSGWWASWAIDGPHRWRSRCTAGSGPAPPPWPSPRWRTPSASVQRPNQPGTTVPANWSLPLPVAVDDLPGHDGAAAVLAALARGRAD